MKRKSGQHDRVLMLIAILKFCKAAILILAGIGAIEMLHPSVRAHAQELVSSMGSPWLREHAEHVLRRIADGRHPGRLQAAGIGAFVYAALFLVEGVGLWLEKRWAEYVTVIITGSLIPFEIYELVHHFTAIRLVTLSVNLGVVAYLVLRLRSKR